MGKKKTEYGVKPYEELDFSDDFMFGKVTQNKELSRNLLKCLLQREVGELENITSQKEFRDTKDGKPIRMDMYSRDETTVYDSEMMNLNNKTVESLQLPRRTRFYQSSLDKDHLEKKGSYRSLPDSTILFICTFDPFGKNIPKYTFKSRCVEDDKLFLRDGTEKIFCNCTYTGDDVPEEIKQFYDYMQTGRLNSELTRQIEEAVGEARKREEWKSEYMKERVLLMDAREEGREEGRQEGREEGREQGREEERVNTERERERADREEERANKADKRADKAEAELERYIMTFGKLKN